MIVTCVYRDSSRKSTMNAFPEAVTFDFHNTIAICDDWFQLEVYDLLPAFIRWHNTAHREGPITSDPALAMSAYRKIRGDIMDHGLEKDAATCVDLVLREFGYTLASEHIHTGVEAVMRETLGDSMPSPGITDSVHRLKGREVKLGVVSSAAYHPFLEWSLEKFSIGSAFDSVVTSASCGFYKSRTEIYTIAVDSLGANPSRSIHVGDSEVFDVATASRIGMGTILYDPERKATSGSQADAVVHTLEGIDTIISDVYRSRQP
jgi:FMN phosphatase YigB (HAD superfamily)